LGFFVFCFLFFVFFLFLFFFCPASLWLNFFVYFSLQFVW
jgi:hypothetical protein